MIGEEFLELSIGNGKVGRNGKKKEKKKKKKKKKKNDKTIRAFSVGNALINYH